MEEYADMIALQRNLVENGGMLDEVIFAVHTDNEHDLEYLDQLVNTTHSYTKYQQEKDYEWLVGSWEKVERGNIYIKIDDDVVSTFDLCLGIPTWLIWNVRRTLKTTQSLQSSNVW
jgi:hypothetical protein